MSRSFRGGYSRTLARDLLRTKRTVADYDYYADKDRYVSEGDVEAEARRLVDDIKRSRAQQRTASIRARTLAPRSALDELNRLTMTPADRLELIKTQQMFASSGVDFNDDTLKILKDLNKETQQVVPVKYYECPVDWNEYTSITDGQAKAAGVVWQNANGNFCLPPTVTDETNRVNKFTYNRVPSEAAVRRQLSAQLKQLRELQETPEERNTRVKAEQRAKDQSARRVQQAEATEKRRDTAVDKAVEQREIYNLMEILQNLPSGKYAAYTPKDLEAKAKQIYAKANSCAAHTGKKSECTPAAGCMYGTGGSCYPKEWYDNAKTELSEIRRSNKSGVPLSASRAKDFEENEAMVEWWQEYYPQYRARARAKKAKELDETSVIRSLMSAN